LGKEFLVQKCPELLGDSHVVRGYTVRVAKDSIMTSKRPTECFVYITLPGAREPVTAGGFVLERAPAGEPLGRFVYGRSCLGNRDGVEIDPVELKLSELTYETTRLNGIFGTIRDAAPDLALPKSPWRNALRCPFVLPDRLSSFNHF
jgi:hypothetical protein